MVSGDSRSFFYRGMWGGCLVVALVAALPGPGHASFVINQTDNAGDFDAAVRILTTGGSGTGTLIGRSEDGTNLFLCLVTADHLFLNGSTLNQIGFRGTGQADTFNFTPSSSAVFHGGPTGSEDLAFIGVTVALASLTNQQRALLEGVGDSFNPVAYTTAPANANLPFNFLENGYGRSATPDPTFNTATDTFAYIYHSNAVNFPAEQYGTERFFDNTITTYGNFNDGTFAYASESWFLRNAAGGAIAGEGQGNSGDSGAALLVNGNIQGVLTNVWGDNNRTLFTDGAGNEGFKIGSEGLGLRFTQADVDWLNARCDYCVPEPSSWAIMLFLTVSVIGCRKKTRQAA